MRDLARGVDQDRRPGRDDVGIAVLVEVDDGRLGELPEVVRRRLPREVGLGRPEHSSSGVEHDGGRSLDEIEIAVEVDVGERGGTDEGGRQRRTGHEGPGAGVESNLAVHHDVRQGIAVQIPDGREVPAHWQDDRKERAVAVVPVEDRWIRLEQR